MSKSNTKSNLKLVPNTKKKPIGAPLGVRDTPTASANENPANKNLANEIPQTLERLATVDFWQQEIAGLKAEQFTSVAQATDKLISQVLERLTLNTEGSGDTAGSDDVKEFLRLVFESSEVLQSTLRKALNLPR